MVANGILGIGLLVIGLFGLSEMIFLWLPAEVQNYVVPAEPGAKRTILRLFGGLVCAAIAAAGIGLLVR
jgi:hypothetical protein